MFSNINAIQLEEQVPFPFFHFSSHYESSGLALEDFDLLSQPHDLLFQYQQQQPSLMKTTTPDDSISEIVTPQTCRYENVMLDSSKTGESAPVNVEFGTNKSTENVILSQNVVLPKKRSSKKDRHSKIYTAQGPRDRRMRLSLEVARDFFGLQDMLGYDKASKTVEWLLFHAKSEIQKIFPHKFSTAIPNLSSVATTLSSTSECEVLSSEIDKGSISTGKVAAKGRKATRQPRRVSLRPLAKDMRKKARARAKARTEAKKAALSENLIEPGEESVSHSQNNIINPSPMEVEEPSSCGHQERIHGDMVDESLTLMIPNSIFNYLPNNSVPPEQQQDITDFQAFEKTWEGYSNQNLY